jgi:hypothetical protein
VFSEHQPIIQRWAQDHPDNLRDVLRFVILTVRYPLASAVEDMRDDNPRALLGWKFYAWDAAEMDKARNFEVATRLNDCSADPEVRAFELVSFIATLPGFGLAKAGFVAQLAFGLAGCLDTHNLGRFGYGLDTFAHYKRRKTAGGRAKLARRYLAAVDACGGTEDLWNSWCEFVAGRDKRYDSAEHVSRLHAEAFCLL